LSLRLASTQQQLDECRRATASAEAAANDAATERQRQATAHNEDVSGATMCCVASAMCRGHCGVMVIIMLLLLLSVVAMMSADVRQMDALRRRMEQDSTDRDALYRTTLQKLREEWEAERVRIADRRLTTSYASEEARLRDLEAEHLRMMTLLGERERYDTVVPADYALFVVAIRSRVLMC
jgi:hypothetical protein